MDFFTGVLGSVVRKWLCRTEVEICKSSSELGLRRDAAAEWAELFTIFEKYLGSR
jgi:hypothetical protein